MADDLHAVHGDRRCACRNERFVRWACGHLLCRAFVASAMQPPYACPQCQCEDSATAARARVTEQQRVRRAGETTAQRARRLSQMREGRADYRATRGPAQAEQDRAVHRQQGREERADYRATRGPAQAEQDRAVNREQQERVRRAGETFPRYAYDPDQALHKFMHDGGASRFPGYIDLQRHLRDTGDVPVAVVEACTHEVENKTIKRSHDQRQAQPRPQSQQQQRGVDREILQRAGAYLADSMRLLICGASRAGYTRGRWTGPSL